MNTTPSQTDGLAGAGRYERKFLEPETAQRRMETSLKLHPAFFREIHHERLVESLYLDSLDLHAFQDNLSGATDRGKIRIRWYDSIDGSTINEPFLEFKSRQGDLVFKERFPLQPFLFGRSAPFDSLRDSLNSSDLHAPLRARLLTARPVLLVRYNRRYFISADSRFRATVDREIRWDAVLSANGGLGSTVRGNTCILEVKYATDADDSADNVTGRFPFRISKSSKYAMGIRLAVLGND